MYAAGKAIQNIPSRLPDVLGRNGAPNREPFDSAFAAEYNFSPVALVTLDQNGVIVRLNLAAANLLKGDRSQLLRLPFLAFVEKSCCRTFLDHFASCVQLRRRVSTEIVLANYTRSGAQVELQSIPGIDQSGKVICRMAIITKSGSDRSERELATKIHSENQRADAELFELSPDAVIVHVGGKIATATAGAAMLLGAGSVSDLLGKDLFQFIHPNCHGLVRERLQRLRQSEKELPIAQETFVRLDGSSVTVNVAFCSAIYQGNPAALILARELAKHQELEENLHLVEDLSGQILANNSIATAIISLLTERFVNAN
ncbi:MAG TPA: PAS domain S-box protein, partial [Chthoniobacterales bacterium]|nr:PAS domain S-box protein [Chthoniobacterales bacterium]